MILFIDDFFTAHHFFTAFRVDYKCDFAIQKVIFMSAEKNLLGEPLEECCGNPITGFFRDGFCRSSKYDAGSHTVCALISNDFLLFSKGRGNDLSTPRPEYKFPGLVAGDSWCLCASRWLEAFEADCAPRIFFRKTNSKALDLVPLDVLRKYAIDLS